jgi:CheY-like chemotaxis protein
MTRTPISHTATPGPPIAAPVEILLVEDDPGDVLMTQEALQASKLLHRLTVLDNGEEAIRYLRQEDPYGESRRPDLVLLDLNLPRLDGREVLSLVKADPSLRQIPCVVLTTSDAEDDVIRSYDLHANAYVTKPVDFDAFTRVVRQIDDFFFTIVRLPQT